MNKSIATLALFAFVVVDAVLVYLALQPPKVLEIPRVATTPVVVSSADLTAPATSPSSTKTTSTAATLAAQPLTLMISALDRTTAWRAAAGTCQGGGAKVQISTDGGKTWSTESSPARAVTRVQPLATARGFVLAADKDCRLGQYTTTDGGQSWTGSGSTTGAWGRKPDAAEEIYTPQDPAARPCTGGDVVDLARSSATGAQVLCQDGTVRQTIDGGQTWRDAGEVKGALAIANRVEGNRLVGYAARSVDGCAGVQLVRIGTGGQGADPEVLACIEADLTDVAGRVALSTPKAGGWLLVGKQTFTAGADLTSWKAA